MLYLESTAVACYQAKEELTQNFSSIFGANERSRNFYSKYSVYIQMSNLGKFFLKEYGISSLVEILKYINVDTKQSIPLSAIWLCIAAVPGIIENTSDADYLKFKEILLTRLNCVSNEDINYIKSHIDETNYFLDTFSKDPQLSKNDSLIIQLIRGNILTKDPSQRIENLPQIPSIPSLGKDFEDEKLNELTVKITSEIQDWNKEANIIKDNLEQPKSKTVRVINSNKTCDQCEREDRKSVV